MAESVDGKVTLLWPWHSMQVEQTTSPNRAGARVGGMFLELLPPCGEKVTLKVGAKVGGVLGQPPSGESPNMLRSVTSTFGLLVTTQFSRRQFMNAPAATMTVVCGMKIEARELAPLNAD